jgi:hypothetical protein
MMVTAGVAETRQTGQWHDGVRLELGLTRMRPSALNTQSSPGGGPLDCPCPKGGAKDKKRSCAQLNVARAGLPLTVVCLALPCLD